MIADFKSKQFLVFLSVGGFAAIVNFGSRFFYNEFISYEKSILLAYITGMIIAFVLSKLFVFEKSSHPIQKEVFYFIVVNIVAIVQMYIISLVLAHYVLPYFGLSFYPEAIAHAFGVICPVFTSFIGHKYFSFK